MNPQLQQLKDIHLPKNISTWPIATGWLMLYVLVLLIIGFAIYYFYQRKKKNKAIRFALIKLKALEMLLKNNPEKINIAAEISTLIRRTALCYFQRQKVAGLTGDLWLQFLNHSGNTQQFSDVGSLLIDAPYRHHTDTDIMPLFPLTRAWLTEISKHKIKSEK